MKLVSAIMPTRGRKEWAAQALHSFLTQTYPNKQLIILDDEEDRSFDWKAVEYGMRDGAEVQVWPPANVHYFHSVERNIAVKRNMCCALAEGEIICHFDSDDWSAPERIADQVTRLEESGKAVTGYCTMPFFDVRDGKASVYENDDNYIVGTSLCYLKEFWQRHAFRDRQGNEKKCEDNLMLDDARGERQLISVPCGTMMVARVHNDNAVTKHPWYYRQISTKELNPAFFQ